MNNGYNEFEEARPIPPQPEKTASLLGIFSMISGIAGLFTAGFFPIVAIVLGYVARKKSPVHLTTAKAGIIMGWIGVALLILSSAFVALLVYTNPDLAEKYIEFIKNLASSGK